VTLLPHGQHLTLVSQITGNVTFRFWKRPASSLEPIQKVTSAGAQVIRKRILNRISIGIGILILAVAAFTLSRLLSEIELNRVVAEVQAKPVRALLTATCFVAISYLVLTCYDLFALRTIGRNDIPYRVAAFAGFTAYTIGHNLGATVFTAGAIRLRIYSAWGLGLIDVGKIAFVTGLTFWLGNAFVLGTGMVFVPAAASAIDHLPIWVNRAIGFSSLVLIGVYLCWLLPRPRVLGPSKAQLVLPGVRLTLLQIAIGVLDLSAAAAVLYTLLPAEPSIDFLPFVVVFATALLLGFLSHAPDSLGVIEAAMLIGLAQFQKEELLASLLVFRALYFMLPLAIAAILLGARELWLLAKAAHRREQAERRSARRLSNRFLQTGFRSAMSDTLPSCPQKTPFR
jgi:uncharacterized membrane protein YbhN (UPF0104 family)